jgi:HSP20 family molecular chaperone IbpA
MNNLNYVTVGVLGTVLALGACSNNPDATQMLNTTSIQYKQEKVEAAVSTVPKWFTTLPTDEKAIYSVGTAQSPDMQLSVDMATLNAKYTLADRINGKLDAMMKTFVSRLGTDDDVSATTLSEVEKVTKNVIASVDVAGYNPKEVKIHPTGTQYRAFVLLEYSEEEARKIIMNRMMKDRMVYSKIKSTNAWKELEKEVNASKTEDQVTSMSNIETELNKVVQ